MSTDRAAAARHPAGEQPLLVYGKEHPVIADTFAGRVHVEWEEGEGAAMTPLGRLPFFIEYLKQGGLFDGWVAGFPLSLTSPNAPSKRDILGTVMLSVLAGHRRYAHITALRCDPVNPPLLGMAKVVSEDAVRRALGKIAAEAGRGWLQGAARVLHPAAVARAVDPRCRHHGEAALRPSGGRGGWLQSDEAGAAVAHLPQLHVGQFAAGVGGRGSARQPARGEALGSRAVGAVGSARARMCAPAAARRSGLGQ